MPEPRAPHLEPSARRPHGRESWYACLYAPPSKDAPAVRTPALVDVAQEFSPRFEVVGDETVIDVTGLDRLLGAPRVIGEELRRTAAARGLRVHVAVAATRMAALVLARTRPGLTVVDCGGEREALAAVSVDVIQILSAWCGERMRPGGEQDRAAESLVAVLRKWGIKTLGGLAALPPDDLAARLGRQG